MYFENNITLKQVISALAARRCYELNSDFEAMLRFAADLTGLSKEKLVAVLDKPNGEEEDSPESIDCRLLMLRRLVRDCEDYIEGPEDKNCLWAKDVEDQIAYMYAIYWSLPCEERPDWVRAVVIKDYAFMMGALDEKRLNTKSYNIRQTAKVMGWHEVLKGE